MNPLRTPARGVKPNDLRPIVAEFIGTGFLVAGVVGSGIMAERLSDDVGLQLLENAFATAGILLALILALGPVSGAHFNPIVTLAERVRGTISTTRAASFVASQIAGGMIGVILANLMFDLDAVTFSEKSRSGSHLLLSEVVATLGLLLVIYGVVFSARTHLAAATVAGYIGAAYWFTSSTSFANPAVTIARTMSDTFAGIEPGGTPAFIGAQLVGAAIGIPLCLWLFTPPPST